MGDGGDLFGEQLGAAGGVEFAGLGVEAGDLIGGGGSGVANEASGVAFVSCWVSGPYATLCPISQEQLC